MERAFRLVVVGRVGLDLIGVGQIPKRTNSYPVIVLFSKYSMLLLLAVASIAVL